jgi:hypothetical protein
MEELLIGCSGALCKSRLWEISIDRLLFRSIDFGQSFDRSTFQDLRSSRHFLVKFVIPLLLTYINRKTQKLTKTSENNKAKGLTSANQGVQIHNIWHSSPDNFLIILISIWTHRSLDQWMTLTLIPITRHGTTCLISRGMLKLLKIMLHNFMNCTIRHIRNSMINHIPLNIKQLHSSSLRLHHLLNQILTFKLKCWNFWARSIRQWTVIVRQWPLSVKQWTLTLNPLLR